MRGVACFTFVFLLTVHAWAANPPSEEVKAQVRKATAEYNLGQYLEAAKDYEAAYVETLDANLLFNVAQAYRLGGEIDKAITAYRSYLRSGPRGEQRALAEAKLHELEEKRAAAVPTPSGTPPSAPVGATSAPAPVATPGPSAPTAPTAAASENQGAALVTAPPSEPSPSPPFYRRWPFWAATGLVVAGAVVTAVLLGTRGSDRVSIDGTTLGTKDF